MLRRLWSSRLLSGDGAFGFAWNTVAVLIALLAPSLVTSNGSFAAARLPTVGFALVLTIGLLGLALFLARATSPPDGVRLITALIAAVVCYGGAILILVARSDIRSNPWECLAFGALGIAVARVWADLDGGTAGRVSLESGSVRSRLQDGCGGLPDVAERREVVEFLKAHKLTWSLL